MTSPRRRAPGGAGAGACFAFLLPSLPLWAAMLIAVPLMVAGLFGDLTASAFKRAARIKDYGGLLKAHGGFLDRFDGVLFAYPIAWAIFRWL